MAKFLSKLFEDFLSKLTSAAENELRLLLGVEKEKQKLGSNMSRIIAVLQDVESRQVLESRRKIGIESLKMLSTMQKIYLMSLWLKIDEEKLRIKTAWERRYVTSSRL